MRHCSKKGTISYLSRLVPTWYCLSLGSPENSLRQEWRCDYDLLGQPGSKGVQQGKWLQWIHWLHSTTCQARKRCAHLACWNFVRCSVKSNSPWKEDRTGSQSVISLPYPVPHWSKFTLRHIQPPPSAGLNYLPLQKPTLKADP